MGFAKSFKKAHGNPTGKADKYVTQPLGLSSPKELWDGMTGKSAADAAEEAHQMRVAFADKSMALQRQQFDDAKKLNQPYVDAGKRQLGKLESGSTISGFGSNLNELMKENAIGDVRNAAMQGTADSMGLRTNIDGMGDVRAGEAASLENLLTQRKQSLAGQSMTSAGNTMSVGQSSANNISNTQSGLGDSAFNTIMAQAQARNQGLANIGNLGAASFDYFRGSNPNYQSRWGDAGSYDAGGGSMGFAGDTDLGSMNSNVMVG